MSKGLMDIPYIALYSGKTEHLSTAWGSNSTHLDEEEHRHGGMARWREGVIHATGSVSNLSRDRVE